LPEAIAVVLGKGSSLTKIFASIGLFGLIASFHGTILAGSRQVFAMARSGYLPATLAKVNHRFKTPHWSIVAGGFVSFLALFTGTTSQVIILSVLGAVVMYITSMISLFILRRKEPGLHRPFKSPFYPVFPALALLISVICLIAIVYYNFFLSLIFAGGLTGTIFIFILTGKYKTELKEDLLVKNNAAA
jgi:ethanolamine permease